MKTRTGFVSNSSSSSFVVNVEMDHEDAPIVKYLRACIEVGNAYGKKYWVKEHNAHGMSFSVEVPYGDENMLDLFQSAEEAGQIEVLDCEG